MEAVTKENAKDVIKTAFILGFICLIVTALLAGGNMLTKDKIQQHKEETTIAAQQKILPAQEYISMENGIVAAKNGSETVGYCVSVSPEGFGGPIELLVGIKENGAVSGIEIISMKETAGLGANATKDSFKEQFSGKKLPLAVVKNTEAKDNEIDALTSATITTKAVVSGVNEAMERLEQSGLLGKAGE